MNEGAFQSWQESRTDKQEDREFRKLLKELEPVADPKKQIQEFSKRYQQILQDAQRIAFLAGAKSVSTEEALNLPDGWQPINEYFGPVELK